MMIRSRTSSISFLPSPRSASTVLNDPGRRDVPGAGAARNKLGPVGQRGHVVAGSLNLEQLRELAGFHASKGCAVSVYVDLDPSVVPTPPDVAAKVNSLLAQGERELEERKGQLTRDERAGRGRLRRGRRQLLGDADDSGLAAGRRQDLRRALSLAARPARRQERRDARRLR